MQTRTALLFLCALIQMVDGHIESYSSSHRRVVHATNKRRKHRSLKGKKQAGTWSDDQSTIEESVDSGEDSGNEEENLTDTSSPTMFPSVITTVISAPSKDNDPPPGTEAETKSPGNPPSTLDSHRPAMMPSVGPSMASNHPSSIPTMGPSPKPSPEPTRMLTSAPIFIDEDESIPEPNDQPDDVGTLIIDPNDPLSYVCAGESGQVTTSSVALGSLYVPFTYELWLEDTSVNFGETLLRVEAAMTRAVAEALLGCASRRYMLQQLVTGVSSAPDDVENGTGGCSDITGCHQMDGTLTLETLDTTGQEEMEIVCGALRAIQDSVATVAATTSGVGAIRYEESTILCGDMPDSIQGGSESKARIPADSSTGLGGGATVAIAFVGLVVLAAGLFVARRHRKRASLDAVAEVPCKDVMSLQLSYTNSSSPRTGFFGGASYTILADIQSMGSADPNGSSDLPSSAGSPPRRATTTGNMDADLFGPRSAFPFPMDAIDPQSDRSLHSSEGGFIPSDQDDAYSDSERFPAYATPVHLMQHQLTPPKGDSPPSGLSSFNYDDEHDDLQEKKVASPDYPGLSSLLGQASDSEGTDDDRSVVQFLDGGVSLLKMSDLEGTHQHDTSDDDVHLV